MALTRTSFRFDPDLPIIGVIQDVQSGNYVVTYKMPDGSYKTLAVPFEWSDDEATLMFEDYINSTIRSDVENNS